MRFLAAVLVGILTITAPAIVQSQDTVSHSQFRATVGVGYGSVALDCESYCGTSREGGLAGLLRLGAVLRPGFLLGGELTGWSKTTHGASGSGTILSAVTQVYPFTNGNFYVMGGLGIAFLNATVGDPDFGSVDAATTNLALQLGVGYDIGVSHHATVTPYVEGVYAVGANARVDGTYTGVNAGANMLHAGLAITWR